MVAANAVIVNASRTVDHVYLMCVQGYMYYKQVGKGGY